MRRVVYILIASIGIIFILRGIGDFALYASGEKAVASINYSTRTILGRPSMPLYIGHYTFSPEDKSLHTGSALIGKDVSSGYIIIRYLKFYPDFNSIDSGILVVWGMCWCFAGIVLFIPNINSLKRFSVIEERARKIFKSKNDNIDYIEGFQKRNPLLKLVIVLGIIAAAGFSTWYFFRAPVDTNIKENASDSSRGNSPGNISSQGMFASFEDKLYFINIKDNHKIYSMKEDGSSLKKITDDPASYINVINGYIYYANFNDGDKVYKIKTDGSNKQKVYKWKSSYINLLGSWLYLSNGNDHSKLYKVMLDGSGEKQLNNDETEYINVEGNWIYYSNKTDSNHIYKIKTDGTERQRINEVSSQNLILDGDFIYFINTSDSKKIYRIKTDGTGMEKIIDAETGFINILGNDIFYNNMADNGFLYKISISHRSIKKLNDIDSWFISIINDHIYYTESWDTGKIYKMTIDGFVNQLIQ